MNVLLEQLNSKMDAFAEGQSSTKEELLRKIDEVRVELGGKISNLELVASHHSAELKSIKGTLSEHSATLREHSATLREHSATLREHSAILSEHSAILGEHSTDLKEIKREVKGQRADLTNVQERVTVIENARS